MIEVVKNIQMPREEGTRKLYPDLTVGDGFIIPFVKDSQRRTIHACYAKRHQTVTCQRNGDKLYVKRTK